MRFYLALVLMFGAYTSAYASTGKELGAACKLADGSAPALKSDQFGKATWCQGMVEGVVRMMLILQEGRDDSRVLKSKGSVCIPSGVSIGQYIKVVLKYLSDHPDLLDDDAPSLVMEAIIDAYPCKDT